MAIRASKCFAYIFFLSSSQQVRAFSYAFIRILCFYHFCRFWSKILIKQIYENDKPLNYELSRTFVQKIDFVIHFIQVIVIVINLQNIFTHRFHVLWRFSLFCQMIPSFEFSFYSLCKINIKFLLKKKKKEKIRKFFYFS